MQRNHEQYNYAAFASTNTLPLAAGSATVEATLVPYKSVHFSPFAIGSATIWLVFAGLTAAKPVA